MNTMDKYELKIKWAFSDGERWMKAQTGNDLEKLVESMEKEKLSCYWGNYSFGLCILDLEKRNAIYWEEI